MLLRREAPHLTSPDQSQTTHDPDDLVQTVLSRGKEAGMTKMYLSSDQLSLWGVHRSLSCLGESSWTVLLPYYYLSHILTSSPKEWYTS